MHARTAGRHSLHRVARWTLMVWVALLTTSTASARWPTRGGASGDDQAAAVVTGAAGNVYTVGTFAGIATFGRQGEVTVSSNAGSSDVFVVKYNAAGRVLWVKRAGGASTDQGLAIAVDGSENVYVTGSFHGTAGFGGTELVAADAYADVFIAKLDSDGVWQWAVKASGVRQDEGRAIAFLPGDETTLPPTPGSVFVGGLFTCAATFGSTSLSGDCSAYKPDYFVARLDADGAWQWARSAGNGASGYEWGEGLAVGADRTSPLYVIGQTAASLATTESFTSGLGTWTATGLWHTTSACAAPSGGTGAVAYFGQDGSCNFATGAAVSGELVSAPVDLSLAVGDVSLSFRSFLATERLSGYDRATVQVWSFATGWVTLDTDAARGGGLADSGGWQDRTYNISSFAGSSIVVRFHFDSGDALYNTFHGWSVDEVTVGASRLTSFVGKLSNLTGATPATTSWLLQTPDTAVLADVDVDPSNGDRVNLAGTASAAADFSGTNQDLAGQGAFVAQISADGVWQWTRGVSHAVVADRSAGYGVITDLDGNVYLAGSFTGVATFGSCVVDSVRNAVSSEDAFVASTGAGGSPRWISGGADYNAVAGDPCSNDGVPGRAGGAGVDRALAIATDGVGSLHVVGTFTGEATFGDDESVTSVGGRDVFAASLDFTGRWFDIRTWIAGEEVAPPAGAYVASLTTPPDFYVAGVQVTATDRWFHWNGPNAVDAFSRLYALQPVDEIEIHWRTSGTFSDPSRIVTIGKIIWPEQRCTPSLGDACYQVHVVGAPVEIVPAAGGFTYFRHYLPDAESSVASITNEVFEAAVAGYAILQYHVGEVSPGTPSPMDFLVVQSVLYQNAPDYVAAQSWDIGTKVGDPFHDEVGRSGRVLKPIAFFDPSAYDRAARTGPIIPVNRVNPLRLADANKDLTVVWYRRSAMGVYWGEKPVSYACHWPFDPDKIVIASEEGAEVLGQQPLDPLLYPSLQLYDQPVVGQPGFNPNDEHAIFAPSSIGSGHAALFALRADFGGGLAGELTAASDPYVLVKYWNEASREWAFRVFQVLATGAGYDSFRYEGTAGTTVSPPYPLRLLSACSQTKLVGETSSFTPSPFFRDYSSQLWATSAGNGVVQFHYPLQPGFFYDLNNNDVSDQVDATASPAVPGNGCVPWLARLPEAAGGSANPDEPIFVGYTISWPSDVPTLVVGETLLEPKKGLPDIYNQEAVQVVYDENVASNLDSSIYDPFQRLVRVIDPLTPRHLFFAPGAPPTTPAADTCYNLAALPADLATEVALDGTTVILGSADGTKKLPFALSSRLRYDGLNHKLSLTGLFDDTGAGEPLLLLNILSSRDRSLLKSISADGHWDACVDRMYHFSRNPNRLDLASGTTCTVTTRTVTFLWFTLEIPEITCTATGDGVVDEALLIGLQDKDSNGVPEPVEGLGQGRALTAGFAESTGFVTLAFNNHPSLAPLPVSLKVIRVDCLESTDPPILSSYQGEIKVIEAENVFDEQLTLRHSGDFAGNADAIEFEWYFHPDMDGTPPEPLPDPDAGQLNGWLPFSVSNPFGANEITIGGANIQTLSDNWYIARYRNLSEQCGTKTGWSLWAGQPGGTPLTPRAQLAEGWVKRVVRRLNPFEARVQAFHSSATNNFASMLVQLGERYEGDIAFSNDPDNLNSMGLIEAYETVLRRAMALSVDSTPPVNYGPANAAILNVSSRITDFYSLLGNESFSDAQDPTVGISSDDVVFGIGSLAPTIFNFENQTNSLLDEELTLLRGRDDSQGPVAARPVYNRFFWNFTSGTGEVAYALSYNISDANLDGVLDEYDARILYPQGHGDAWGHYLTGLTKYYDLLRHPFFTWEARPEAVLVAGVPIQVDYFDERKFATAAAAKARAGAEVVDLTYRREYVEDAQGQWQGYLDTDDERAWGLTEWGRRAGMGAYLDWVVGTSIVPAEDPDPSHVGIQRIERSTVDDLDEVAAEYTKIQAQLDEADRGLNPLGLAKGVVPFDLDPAEVDGGLTHYEQIAGRAQAALENAVGVWDYANQLNRMLRFNQDTIEDLNINAFTTELDYNNQLIEIFGSPYDADIGATGLYPDGYDGPDLYHYMMVDAPALKGTPLYCDPTATTDPCNAPDSPQYIGYATNRFTGVYAPMNNGVNFFNLNDTSVGLCPANDPGCLCESGSPNCGNGLDCADNPFSAACTLGDAPNTSISVNYWTWEDAEAGYYFVKDPSWPADTKRRASGKIQDALYQVVQAEIGLKQAFKRHDNQMRDIMDQADTMRATFNLRNDQIGISSDARHELAGLTAAVEVMRGVANGLRIVSNFTDAIWKESKDCVPSSFIAGLAAGGDIFSAVKCAMGVSGKSAKFVLDNIAAGLDIARDATDAAKEDVSLQASLETQIQDARFEIFLQKGTLDHLVREEPVLRADIYAKAEEVAQANRAYLSALAEGQRVLGQLITFRKRGAAAVQEHRYQDMAFRVFRNDALQKYRAAFDMTARYAYLAATAYDYDTNLLGSDAEAGQGFLTDIVRERSIGQVMGGVPVPGSRGLADPLGRMEQNFAVLKGQMGFNNPQVETNRFSLRRELFRLGDDEEADAEWTRLLAEHRVDDLWQIPEFRRYARPFAPQSQGPQPGLVISFPTTVTFGLNFFGWPLGAGDSAYDPTNFATRVRGVGVWFEDYAALPLANTPRVYLIPVGADVLRSPSSNDFRTREWSVSDQVLPVPFPIGAQELAEPTWTPLQDMLSGPFGEIRRFSSFLAYHYEEPLDEDQLTADSRLIGRSVWNARWMLIIPGGTLLYDPADGLDTFIEGDGISDGVSDIKIFFKTYAYSGN